MLPPRTRLDPEGYYAVLGLDPAASPEAITTAFRRKARELHPDVPGTGDSGAFVIVRQAYDVLSNRQRRQRYDVAAQQAPDWPIQGQHPAQNTAEPGVSAGGARRPETTSNASQSFYDTSSGLSRRPRFSDLPLAVWVGLGAFLCLCIIEATLHLRSQPVVVSTDIRPNAPPVTPLSPVAQRAVLYGPTPIRLAGTPNFYVIPAADATVLWRKDSERDRFVPLGQLPPFSTVHAVRLHRQNGLVEVLFNDTAAGFVDATRLTPGDADAARRAYCGYNSGSAPMDGELLEHRGQGSGTIQLENRAQQPVVVKLRDASGVVVLSVFLAPGGRTDLADLPAENLRPDFAIGELWSRACNSFAAGMRARRMAQSLTAGSGILLAVPPEQDTAATDISDQSFAQE